MNHAIHEASGEILLCLDADTLIARDAIHKLVRHFTDVGVGAVAGNIKVGNRTGILTRWQAIEYITSQNLDRRAYALFNAVTVVPGAIGAWRKEAVLQVGGYREDTLAEDTDLTWRVRRAGWRVEADNEALGFTEAPETLSGLFRQRFRWTFGTLQCLWKHRDALGRYGWFGCVLLPSLWLFQIVFQALAPLVDLQVFWAALADAGLSWLFLLRIPQDSPRLFQESNPLYTIGLMYGLFFLLELACAVVAFRFDCERMRLLWSLFWQRFAYRQLMYLVLFKSVLTALRGMPARWMKVERMGTAKLATG